MTSPQQEIPEAETTRQVSFASGPRPTTLVRGKPQVQTGAEEEESPKKGGFSRVATIPSGPPMFQRSTPPMPVFPSEPKKEEQESFTPTLSLPESMFEPEMFEPELDDDPSVSETVEFPVDPKMLIVEDSRTMRTIIKRMCLARGVDPDAILEAKHGADALELIAEHEPILILSDVVMPEVDGVEMLQQVRYWGLAESSSIVFMTSQATDQTRQALLELGARHVLRKPFRAEALSEYLDEFISVCGDTVISGTWTNTQLDKAVSSIMESIVSQSGHRVDEPVPQDRILCFGQITLSCEESSAYEMYVGCTLEVATRLVMVMMGMNPQHDDAIRFDAVQELCNIIAGELIADQSEPWRLTPATCDIYKPGGAPITQAHSYEFRDFEDLTLYVGIKAV